MFSASGRIVKALRQLGGAVAIATLFVLAAFQGAAAGPSSAAPTGADTSVPFGWADFCQRYHGECAQENLVAQQIALTPAALRKIARVNAWVNGRVTPVSDREHFGAVEQWDYPTDGKGDCEDYALLKRHMLVDAGFPRAALLMTVVKEANGDGHSVLMVRTDKGDYVLDNMNDAVKAWTATPYRFVKRQSQENPNVWVAIGAPTTAPAYVSNKDAGEMRR